MSLQKLELVELNLPFEYSHLWFPAGIISKLIDIIIF